MNWQVWSWNLMQMSASAGRSPGFCLPTKRRLSTAVEDRVLLREGGADGYGRRGAGSRRRGALRSLREDLLSSKSLVRLRREVSSSAEGLAGLDKGRDDSPAGRRFT